MSVYRSSQGKIVDMAALAAKNERVRSVGNMKTNARGDIIDGNGNIITPVNEKINDQYAKTVGNKSAIVQSTRESREDRAMKAAEEARKALRAQLTEAEREIEDSMTDDYEVEQIKAGEAKRKK
jgi:hypothetical protein